MKLPIKPLTVNQAWQGRRFKTDQYKSYERDVITLLRPLMIPEGALHIDLEFGFSNMASDWDNPIKPFVDCLQKKYGFNDSRIHSAKVRKVKVSKGQEYIAFSLRELEAV